MNSKRYERLRSALERRQPDLTVLLENVHKPHNFSAVVRTADATGLFEAHAVYPGGHLPTGLTPASGAAKWVRVRVHRDLEAAIDRLRRGGMTLLAAHPGPDAEDFRALDYTRPTAVLFGQEKDGLSAAALETADARVSIPMVGLVTSLNVSVAAALILFEAQRQRLAAGLYERSRLPADVFEKTIFEWAYPRLAEHCRRKGLEYPALSLDGEPIEPIPR